MGEGVGGGDQDFPPHPIPLWWPQASRLCHGGEGIIEI